MANIWNRGTWIRHSRRGRGQGLAQRRPAFGVAALQRHGPGSKRPVFSTKSGGNRQQTWKNEEKLLFKDMENIISIL